MDRGQGQQLARQGKEEAKEGRQNRGHTRRYDQEEVTGQHRMRRDGLWLTAILLFGLVPRLYTLTHTTTASRDCVNFIQLALNLDDPVNGRGETIPRSQVLRNAEHPLGYPVALLGTAYLVRGTTALGQDDWMRVGQYVSIAAGSLLCLPIYFLGRNAFRPRTGLLAAALAVALPTLAEVTADALSDGLFLLMNISALAFLQYGIARSGWKACLLAGAFGGLAYLVRPEGALTVLAGGGMIVLLVVRTSQERGRWLACGTALALGFLVVAGPYVATIGKFTNKPSGSKLLRESQDEPTPHVMANTSKGNLPRVILAAKMAIGEILRTSHGAIGILGLAGAVLLRKNLPGMMLVVYAGLAFLMLGYLGYSAGYVSRRHALSIAVIACVFAAELIQQWAENVCKRERLSLTIAVGLLLALSWPFNFKPLHANRAAHKQAGLWVGENVPANAIFVDPFTWAEFYAGRSFRSFPNSDRDRVFDQEFVYVMIEPNNPEPGSVLTQLAFAQEYAAKGVLVYQWPPDLSGKNAVAIYKAPFLQKK
jgi:hypothetical protein